MSLAHRFGDMPKGNLAEMDFAAMRKPIVLSPFNMGSPNRIPRQNHLETGISGTR